MITSQLIMNIRMYQLMNLSKKGKNNQQNAKV